MNQQPLHVHYCHGLESGPMGFKAQSMRSWAKVTVPDQHMSIWDFRRENAVIRSLIRQFPARPYRHLAVLESLDRCVQVQRNALDQPDVLVGSSWGGVVATVLLAEGLWTGPTVLLCPALRMMERRIPALDGHPRSADALIGAIAALSDEARSRLCLVHATADEVVPIEDSREIAWKTGIRFEVVEGGSHGLSGLVGDGRLRRWVTETAAVPCP